MSSLAVRPRDTTTGLATLAELHDAARHYIRASKAKNTVTAYQSDWRAFEVWCRSHELEPLPAAPATIVLYLTELATRGRKASTITRHTASISIAHQLAGHKPPPTQDPAVRDALRGIRRTIGTARTTKTALTVATVRRMLDACDPTTLAGARDRALLLVAFATACRRSELAALDVRDVSEDEDGLRITVRRSKGDQEAAGEIKGVPYGSHPATCPVRALRAWLRLAALTDGPIFRPVDRHGRLSASKLSGDAIADVIKRGAARAGLDPREFAGHSTRRGFATTAARNGAPERWIQRQTGHRSVVMLRAYVEDGTLFTENAASYLGL